jgi:hypothetical protein
MKTFFMAVVAVHGRGQRRGEEEDWDYEEPEDYSGYKTLNDQSYNDW